MPKGRALTSISALLAFSFSRQPRLTLLGLIGTPLGAAIPTLAALWLKLLVDAALSHRLDQALTAATLLALTGGAAAGIGIFTTRTRIALYETLGYEIDGAVLQAVGEIPGIEHLERPELLDRIALIRSNTNQIGQMWSTLVGLIADLVQLIVTAALLASVSPLLLGLLLAGLPSLLIDPLIARWSNKISLRTAWMERQATDLCSLAYNPTTSAELRVFGLEDEIISRYVHIGRDRNRQLRRVQFAQAPLNAISPLVSVLAMIGAVTFVALRAVHHLATPGDVVLAVYLASQLAGLTQSVASTAGFLTQSTQLASHFAWVLGESRAATGEAKTEGTVPACLNEGISIEGLSFTYPGTDAKILSDLNLHFPAGTIVAVVGDNGAGKTTLTKLLLRLYQPTTGQITIDRIPLHSIPHDRWRSHTAAGFQDFGRFELLARETIGLGNLPDIDNPDAVTAALHRAGSSSILAALPDGLDTQLGRSWTHGAELSGGQWQKLALARALMRQHPLLLVLDEPTSALDAATEHALFARYAAAARASARNGMIVLLVSHRFSTVRMADQIVVLEAGHVTEVGNHDELIRRNGHYAELYNLQAHGYR